ncbi:hypothetical protein QFC20_002788 [Naganishia adeliensis]|uniref:Uncharacterized protein n=1 Tax=Naganishia adeliensis TaxID=92952 RepID=A0ACC2WJM1_9TREE|nr:hypothetical protein QFC20_002788 [Naganishia adeliensis]
MVKASLTAAFGIGWGCGYRNFLMGLTALTFSNPSISSALLVDGKPGVRTIQKWMKEAWEAEYDPQGNKDFKGVIVGTKKWIGTAASTAVSKHSVAPMHHALMRFVEMYFDGQLDNTVFGPILKLDGTAARTSGDVTDDIVVSEKLPLILQHSGHSRTIVGYEVDAVGERSLIMFDPETSIPKSLRNEAISSIADINEGDPKSRTDSTDTPRKRRKTGQQSLLNMMPKTNTEGRATDPIIVVESDEEMDSSGWVRKKAISDKSDSERGGVKKKGASQLRLLRDAFDWNKNPNAVLKHFRVNLKSLSKHDEYQILSFDGAPALLSAEERARRKIVTATTIIPS